MILGQDYLQYLLNPQKMGKGLGNLFKTGTIFPNPFEQQKLYSFVFISLDFGVKNDLDMFLTGC